LQGHTLLLDLDVGTSDAEMLAEGSKGRSREGLGEDVSDIVAGVDILEVDSAVLCALLYVAIAKVNVLGASVVCLIQHEDNCTLIVSKDESGVVLSIANLAKEVASEDSLTSSFTRSNKLSLPITMWWERKGIHEMET
jgi:hypothetical protein